MELHKRKYEIIKIKRTEYDVITKGYKLLQCNNLVLF